MNNIDYKLYLVTDRDVLKGRNLGKAVEDSILGGATIVQLREKDVTSREFYEIAQSIKAITDKHNVPLIINDRLDIAFAVDASGIHIGQSDMPCNIAREVLGKDKLIGVSVHTLEEALDAEKDGADYLGCGAMFSTSTKKDATDVSYDQLKEIKAKVKIPVVAIGGINERNLVQLEGTNIDGVAIISAILGKENIKEATKKLKSKII
ncbi:thiamine phosphate synthase [Clostridium vincentii]|uniref:Thiamine-phosphate synthase n=1 Tax=Clostridium vincentii TaxID=52704 RepID=A0A2T0BEM9_9CLOT|nr:thiamine phosphate synthase [Clostridium vincentii]PRR82356.1 Thiamine-phosphate synthase [Clostridium vincentii]